MATKQVDIITLEKCHLLSIWMVISIWTRTLVGKGNKLYTIFYEHIHMSSIVQIWKWQCLAKRMANTFILQNCQIKCIDLHNFLWLNVNYYQNGHNFVEFPAFRGSERPIEAVPRQCNLVRPSRLMLSRWLIHGVKPVQEKHDKERPKGNGSHVKLRHSTLSSAPILLRLTTILMQRTV